VSTIAVGIRCVRISVHVYELTNAVDKRLLGDQTRTGQERGRLNKGILILESPELTVDNNEMSGSLSSLSSFVYLNSFEIVSASLLLFVLEENLASMNEH